MVLGRRSGRAALLGIIALLASVWIVRSSPSFQQCIREHKHDAEYSTLNEGIRQFRRWGRVDLTRACASDFLDRNDKAINALIAFFTLLLWISTHRLWATAEAQAEDTKQSIEVARNAYLATTRPWVDLSPDLDTARLEWTITDTRFFVRVTGVNIGSSPAIDIGVGISIIPTLTMTFEGNRQSVIDACHARGLKQRHLLFHNRDISGWHIAIDTRDRFAELCGETWQNIVSRGGLNLIVSASYRTPGDKTWHHTGRMYAIGKKASSGSISFAVMEVDCGEGEVFLQRQSDCDYAD